MRPAVALLAVLLTACSPSDKPTQPASTPAPSPPKIVMFYPSQASAAKGEKVLICYGVEDAVAVRIDPPIEELKPSFNRCFDTVAQKSGKFTLTAEGKDGTKVDRSFDLTVEGVARVASTKAKSGTLIHFFSGAKPAIRRGEQTMLCYEVAAGADLSMTPAPPMPLGKPKGCVQVSPSADTKYTLTAKSAAGGSETGSVQVRVQP